MQKIGCDLTFLIAPSFLGLLYLCCRCTPWLLYLHALDVGHTNTLSIFHLLVADQGHAASSKYTKTPSRRHHTLRQDPSLTLHICISGSMRIDMMANDNPLPMSLFMGFQECSGCSSISHQSGHVALLGPTYFRSSPCLQDLLSELRLSLLHTAEDQVSGRTVGQLVQASTNANHCKDVEVP